MANELLSPQEAHPAPHQHRVHWAVLLLGFVGAPIAWVTDLTLKYGVTSFACSSGAASLPEWIFPVLYGVDALALTVVILAAALSYRNWRKTRTESRGDVHELAEVGEGRTRFMSLWGMLFGIAFGAAIIFGVTVNIGLSAC